MSSGKRKITSRKWHGPNRVETKYYFCRRCKHKYGHHEEEFFEPEGGFSDFEPFLDVLDDD